MEYVNRKFSSKGWLYGILLDEEGRPFKTTGEKRNVLVQYFKSKLMEVLGSLDGEVRERDVYEAFRKRHSLEETPEGIEGAEVALSNKFRETKPWLIDKIYRETKERSRKEMVKSVVGDVWGETDEK
jgi:hypothetical protein